MTWRWCTWAPWPTAFRCQQRDRQPGAADRIEGPARRGAGHADLQPAALDDGYRAPVTVPEEEGSYRPGVTSGAAPGASALSYALPRYDGTPPMLERVPRDPQTRGVLDGPPDALRERLLAQFAESGQPGIAGWPTTSNIWLVGRDHARDARAILLNGPQFGWWNPATSTVSACTARASMWWATRPSPIRACCSATTRTWPGVDGGFRRRRRHLRREAGPADRTRYFHDGQWKRMEKRSELILVRAASRC